MSPWNISPPKFSGKRGDFVYSWNFHTKMDASGKLVLVGESFTCAWQLHKNKSKMRFAGESTPKKRFFVSSLDVPLKHISPQSLVGKGKISFIVEISTQKSTPVVNYFLSTKVWSLPGKFTKTKAWCAVEGDSTQPALFCFPSRCPPKIHLPPKFSGKRGRFRL